MRTGLMEICDFCGEPIVFRYVDGRPTPIHVNGNYCSGGRGSAVEEPQGPFRSIASYVVPGAICPVCGEKVFFYQSPSGGRVFFDDLGWPWPKHPCTDNRKQVARSPEIVREGRILAFRARDGSKLALYDLDDFEDLKDHYKFVFRRHDTKKRRTGFLRRTTLDRAGLEIDDFFNAPSFVINLDKSGEGGLRVDFISGRLSKIVKIKMSKKGL